jgi:hypothetical protein
MESRIALETGMHSPWVSRVLSELGHPDSSSRQYQLDRFNLVWDDHDPNHELTVVNSKNKENLGLVYRIIANYKAASIRNV